MTCKVDGCLQTNVFLWKGNKYGCYNNQKNQDEHDKAKEWFCQSCAEMEGSIRKSCPMHFTMLQNNLMKKNPLIPVLEN